jgi:hypothetical protein
MDSITLF